MVVGSSRGYMSQTIPASKRQLLDCAAAAAYELSLASEYGTYIRDIPVSHVMYGCTRSGNRKIVMDVEAQIDNKRIKIDGLNARQPWDGQVPDKLFELQETGRLSREMPILVDMVVHKTVINVEGHYEKAIWFVNLTDIESLDISESQLPGFDMTLLSDYEIQSVRRKDTSLHSFLHK